MSWATTRRAAYSRRKSSRRCVLLTRFRGLFDREPAPRGPTCDLDGPARGSAPVGRFDPSNTQCRELVLWSLALVYRRRGLHQDVPALFIGGAVALVGGGYLRWAL